MILNWLVNGAIQYYNEGLDDVLSVFNATNDYKKKEDTINGFINDCIEVKKNSSCNSSILYQAYCEYCILNDQQPESQTAFGSALKKFGYTKKRISNGIFYLNIGLK